MKGQHFSFDAIIGSVIFFIALTSIYVYWEQTKTRFFETNNIAIEANRVADFLLGPSGFGRDINSDELGQYSNIKPENFSSLVGTPYNVYVSINMSNPDPNVHCNIESIGFPTYSFPVPPNKLTIGKIKRTAVFINNDNTACIADIYVYVW